MWLIELFASRIDVLLSGLAGGFIGLRFYKDINTLQSRIYFVICGGLSGMYAAPFAYDYFKLAVHDPEQNKNALLFFGLIIGLFGPKLVQSILKGIENGAVWDVLKARLVDVLQAIVNGKGK